MTRILWSVMARDDLEDIRLYLKAHDPALARRVVLSIQEQMGRLRHFPLSGEAFGVLGERKLSVVGLPYLLIYRVEGQTVQVERIFHSARNYSRL